MTGPIAGWPGFRFEARLGWSKGLGSPSLPSAPAQAACPPFQGWDCKPWPPYQTFPPHHTLIAIAREHFPWSRSSAVHPLALPPAPFVFPPACNQTKSCTRLNCICIHIHSIELYYLATHVLSSPELIQPALTATSFPSLPTLHFFLPFSSLSLSLCASHTPSPHLPCPVLARPSCFVSPRLASP